MIDATYLNSRLSCSRQDKLDCMSTVKTLCNMAKLARKDGLLALAPMAEGLDPFFHACLNVFLDIHDRDTVRTVLTGYLISGSSTGKEFLNQLLIVHGVMHLFREDYTPQSMAAALQGWFGAELYDDYWSLFRDTPVKYAPRIVSVYPPFDRLALASMPHIIQLAYEVDLTTLALALLGAGQDVSEQFFSAISTREKRDTVRALMDSTTYPRLKDVECAQKFICDYSQNILDQCPDL